MKLDKKLFSMMLEEMLLSYNQFVSAEKLAVMQDAWFNKLKYQEHNVVKKIIENWDDTKKMPNAPQILEQCEKFMHKISSETILAPNEMICKYSDYNDFDECEISRSLCSNFNESWKITPEHVASCIRDRNDKKIICYWHRQVIRDRNRFDGGWWVSWQIEMRKNQNI